LDGKHFETKVTFSRINVDVAKYSQIVHFIRKGKHDEQKNCWWDL